MDVTIWGAFLAGLISFVSPCVLPIVPPYLAWIAGLSFEELQHADENRGRTGRLLASSLAFVLGFSTVFIALGASASVFGQAMRRMLAWTVNVFGQDISVMGAVAGLIIIVFGLHFLGVFRIGLLYREARVQVQNKPAGLVGAYLLGIAFGFGWTPCIGPVLAAILFVAGSEDTVARGAGLLAVYSAGLGVPFLIAAAFAGRFLKFSAGFKRHMDKVEKAMGALLVLTGLMFITGKMADVSFWLLETFPFLQKIG
ncbi:MAG: cytochrome c biogenesis protein CcdA [Phyllobacteriaceae bacterium]|nr:cytochrome c biogenesis protein CcdA [Phyllobacteriaceae bacterium]